MTTTEAPEGSMSHVNSRDLEPSERGMSEVRRPERPQAVFTAHVDRDGLVIRKAVHGGIDGPFLSTDTLADDMEAVATFIRRAGFTQVGPWHFARTANGMSIWASLTKDL